MDEILRFGNDRNLKWFKEHGVISWPKKVRETYWRPFEDARIPVYFEFIKRAGDELAKATKEAGIDWDTSDYQALVEWKPCLAFEDKSSDFDLYAVNYKVVEQTFSTTIENPWLQEISEARPESMKI